jgi:hypothetical protein
VVDLFQTASMYIFSEDNQQGLSDAASVDSLETIIPIDGQWSMQTI